MRGPDPLGGQHQQRRHPGRLDADDAVRQADALLPGRTDDREAAGRDRPEPQPQDRGRQVRAGPREHAAESKAQILDNYLNIAFFGENSYGIQTAAQTYFNKPRQPADPAGVGAAGRRCCGPRREYDPFDNPGRAQAAQRGHPEPRRRRRADPGRGGRVYKATPVALATETAAAGRGRAAATRTPRSRTSASSATTW